MRAPKEALAQLGVWCREVRALRKSAHGALSALTCDYEHVWLEGVRVNGLQLLEILALIDVQVLRHTTPTLLQSAQRSYQTVSKSVSAMLSVLVPSSVAMDF